MKIKKYIVSLFIIVVMLFSMNPITAFADSPVTSTDFYKAYMDVDIVKIVLARG